MKRDTPTPDVQTWLRQTCSRRAAFALPLPLLTTSSKSDVHAPATPIASSEVRVSANPADAITFTRDDFGIVGVFDVDWLVRPDFAHMLDHFAASPSAFSGVRFFGAFTAGQPDLFTPDSSGTVWTDPDGPIDFTATFNALEALTSRGLVPFIALCFFPPAISPSPIHPPSKWAGWRQLVSTFLRELAADPRFGPDKMATWWFEVWNEPNEGRFWSGTQSEYFELYQATSQAVVESGLVIRLGGPAIAYKPQVSPEDGAPWMERFFRFIAADPALRCDFVSIHRKGTVQRDPPDPRRLVEAADATARQMLAIAPDRFRGMTIINNEADEKVGFEVPYAPRMDQTAASWLGAVTAIHAGLDERYRTSGLRFISVADNANLQLVEAPFDGRRSIMMPVSTNPADLIKLPAYGFYELLRLFGDRQATITSGFDNVFPATGLYHLCTVADTHVTALLTWYPDPDSRIVSPVALDYVISDLPWTDVNVARFQIDERHSNAYTVAGGSASDPFPIPDPSEFDAIRRAQEVTVAHPIRRNLAAPNGVYRTSLTLEPYTTLCLWITSISADVPESPAWIEVDVQDQRAVVRWEPSLDPLFYSYELFVLDGEGEPGELLTPEPMRAALWVGEDRSPELKRYGVRVISASGIASRLTSTAPGSS